MHSIRPSSILFAVACILSYLMPTQLLFDLQWHDQQRLGQSVLVTIASWYLVVIYHKNEFCFPAGAAVTVLVLFVMGGMLAGFSQYPAFALLEISLWVTSTALAVAIYNAFRREPEKTAFYVGITIRLVVVSLVAGFLAGYISALINPQDTFDSHNLVTGFSNVRFQGQFLTLVMPLLLLSLVPPSSAHFKVLRRCDRFLAIACVVMVVMAGTRGSVLGWLLACALFLVLGTAGTCKWAGRFLVLMLLGYCLAWLLQQALEWSNPEYGQTYFRMASGTAVTLSGRGALWSLAWETFLANPWLGIGPMHFASLPTAANAHPHQIVLQLLSEWGLPATVVLLGLVLYGFFIMMTACRRNPIFTSDQSPAGLLLFSLTASSGQAMVDGVLVMPYPLLWLSVMAGWALFVFSTDPERSQQQDTVPLPTQKKSFFTGFLTGVCLLSSIYMLYESARYIPEAMKQEEFSSSAPRYWAEGQFGTAAKR